MSREGNGGSVGKPQTKSIFKVGLSVDVFTCSCKKVFLLCALNYFFSLLIGEVLRGDRIVNTRYKVCLSISNLSDYMSHSEIAKSCLWMGRWNFYFSPHLIDCLPAK